MNRILLEACCGSVDDVFYAKQSGADRVELNSAMFLGGLTPSIGAMRLAGQAGLRIMAMVRPREGGFLYSDREFESMRHDTEALLEAGAEGIVFGILLEDGSVDISRCGKILRIIEKKQSVFHRAFDVTPCWKEAMDALISLGVTRILTSGQAGNALKGADTLCEMIEYANGRIEILPGGGIRLSNVTEIIRRTGCSQIHVSSSKQRVDPSVSGNPDIHFGTAPYAPENPYICMDRDQFQAFRGMLQTEVC